MACLASAEAKIRHVFGFTSITEASIGAAPPGNSIAQWFLLFASAKANNILKK